MSGGLSDFVTALKEVPKGGRGYRTWILFLLLLIGLGVWG